MPDLGGQHAPEYPRSNTSGVGNTFLGYYSGKSNTTGEHNIFLGRAAGYQNTSGDFNIFIGYLAGRGNYGGNYNVYLGRYAGRNNNYGQYNVFLGDNAGYSETGSNKLYIENSSSSTPLIYGDFSTNQVGINMKPPSGVEFGVTGDIYATGYLRIDGGGIDNDGAFGGNSDDWIHLDGYIEMKSNTDSYGIVLRNSDGSDFLGISQVDGSSYLAESSASGDYFLKGTNRNVYFGNDVYGKQGYLEHSSLYNFGGLYFTWDADDYVYGTDGFHCIQSSYGYTYGDDLTINSYDNVRVNLDSDGDTPTSSFEIGQHTRDTTNIIFKVVSPTGNVGIGNSNPSYKLEVAGSVNASEYLIDGEPLSLGEDIWMVNGNGIYYNGGNVGIGTDIPLETLHVNGAVRGNQDGALRISTGYGYVDIGPKDEFKASFTTDRPGFYFEKGLTIDEGLVSSMDEDLLLQTAGTTQMTISNITGNVAIGTTPNTTYKLSVEGQIGAREVNVNQDAWPDYVFNEAFPLISLEEVEKFIGEHHHLPNMPSEKDILEHGVNLGAMDAKLLEQIEQLVLHTIAQDKELAEKELRIKTLEQKEKRLNQLEQRLEKLEKLLVEEE